MVTGNSRIEHVKYIRASKDAVWAALTSPRETRRYYFDRAEVAGEFVAGAPLSYRSTDGDAQRVVVEGEVLEAQPGQRLVHTFRLSDTEDPASRVSWDISPFGQSRVKLTLSHEGLANDTETYRRMKTTWSPLLCRLQTLLENGGHGWQ